MKYVVPVYGAVLSMNQIKVFNVKCITWYEQNKVVLDDLNLKLLTICVFTTNSNTI